MNKLFLVILICLLFLFGCASQQTAAVEPVAPELHQDETTSRPVNHAITIGVSMQGLQRPYIVRVKDKLLEIEKRYNGKVKLVIMDGCEDAERQNAQIEGFITRNMDVIIFNPISYEHGALGIELANMSQIPVVLLITSTANSEQAQARAISDHMESAFIQMDMAFTSMKNEGNIVILTGLKGVESEVLRSEGYRQKLEKHPGIHLLESQSANWSSEEATEIVENWLRRGLPIDTIIAQNDNMAAGAVRAVENVCKQKDIAIFGIDGDIEALKLIQEGRLQGTVFHNANRQAELAIAYAVELAAGKQVKSIPVPFEKITRENVDQYFNRP